MHLNDVDYKSQSFVLASFFDVDQVLTAKHAEAILENLHFDGMEQYHQRPLESHPGTFEWLFDDERLRVHPTTSVHGRCLRGTTYCWNPSNLKTTFARMLPN